MTQTSVEEYRLSPAAAADLDGIWSYTVELWSVDQAETYLRRLDEKFQHLCTFPLSNRERTEISPPVRLCIYKSHLIIYRLETDHLAVLRIVHGAQKWQVLLEL